MSAQPPGVQPPGMPQPPQWNAQNPYSPGSRRRRPRWLVPLVLVGALVLLALAARIGFGIVGATPKAQDTTTPHQVRLVVTAGQQVAVNWQAGRLSASQASAGHFDHTFTVTGSQVISISAGTVDAKATRKPVSCELWIDGTRAAHEEHPSGLAAGALASCTALAK